MITIQKSESGATFLVQVDELPAQDYAANDLRLVNLGNNRFALREKSSGTDIVSNRPVSDVGNPDDEENPFSGYEALRIYANANFFKKAGSESGSAIWGGITGFLSAQQDLQDQLQKRNNFTNLHFYQNQIESVDSPYEVGEFDELLRFEFFYIIHSNLGDTALKNSIQIQFTDNTGDEQTIVLAEAGDVGAILVPSIIIYAKAATTITTSFIENNPDITYSGGLMYLSLLIND